MKPGIYTSGVIASLKNNHDIVLFETNIGHTGEFIDRILYKRKVAVTPILMSDARRQFVDVINHFPDEVEDILARYGEIWTNKHKIIELQLTSSERLKYHKTHC